MIIAIFLLVPWGFCFFLSGLAVVMFTFEPHLAVFGGAIHSSVLRDHSRQSSGDHVVLRIRSRPPHAKHTLSGLYCNVLFSFAFLFVCFVWGAHSVVLLQSGIMDHSSWDLGNHMWCWRSNLDQIHARQMSYPLWSLVLHFIRDHTSHMPSCMWWTMRVIYQTQGLSLLRSQWNYMGLYGTISHIVHSIT